MLVCLKGGTGVPGGNGNTPKWPKPLLYVVTSTPVTERNSDLRSSVSIADE